MVCSAKPYNQGLATLSTYHQLIPMSMSYHSYAAGGHGGVMPYKSVFLPISLRTLYVYERSRSLALGLAESWGTGTVTGKRLDTNACDNIPTAARKNRPCLNLLTKQ